MFTKDYSQLKVVLYARKSSESEDRQMHSIEDQKDDLKKIITEYNLNVVRTFEESISAKDPGRPEFTKMVGMIYEGTADAILVWHTNRLFRNTKDSGEIQHMLINANIKAIITPHRVYSPEDNAMLLSVESGMSTQFITDLRRVTLRGLWKKAGKGWMPSRPPIGYINNVKTKEIDRDLDDERFHIVRRMWDYMLTGNYSVPEVWKKSIEWGLRTRKYGRSGNKHLSLSNCYRLFDDPFYYGLFRWKEKLWEGKHIPMITQDEFEQVRKFIKSKDQKPKSKINNFGYSGKMFCEECGCMYTPEYKRKTIKKTGEVKEYRLYRCTRKKKDVSCSQNKYINQDVIDDYVVDKLQNLAVNERVRDWYLDVLESQHERVVNQKQALYESQQADLQKTESELDNLNRMLYRGQISEDFYSSEKTVLEDRKLKLRNNVDTTEAFADDWREVSKRAFDFLINARKVLKNASQEDKKIIVSAIAKNITIHDKEVTIVPHEWISLVQTLNEKLPKSETRVRTRKSLVSQADTLISQDFSLMGVYRDLNPN